MAMNNFAAVLQPGNLGELRLDNRLIMAAMGATSGVDIEGRVTERLLEYYRARARGGVGLVITQYGLVSPDATLPFTLNLYDDSHVPEWRKVVDAIHDSGSRACIQLMHFGMLYLLPGFIPPGLTMKVPSMTPWLRADIPCTEVTEEDIDRYVGDFARAAWRARQAGADAVELHASNGCLVSAFMSPVTNRRSDRYGGSAENRALFARRIVEEIRETVGPGFPVWVRMNATDDFENGTTIEEAVRQAQVLEAAGADAISVTGGLEFWTTVTVPSYPLPMGPMVPLAERVKKAVKVPVIAAGKIDAELADRVIREGRADFVAMGRPLLADPDLPNKVREGRPDEVRRCIYCNNCLKMDPEAGPGPCSVNPFLFHEARYPLPPAEPPRKVMVVGGGLAGMQTAVYLAERGHQVSLYERNAELGGQWNTACATPGKETYRSFTRYLRQRLDSLGIRLHLGTDVTRNMVLEAGPDAVVVATGALPAGLNVPGAQRENVVQGHDVLDGKAEAKGRVVVVGGRFIGIEVAISLAEQGKQVCLVTRAGLGEDGIKLEKMTFNTLARRLLELRVPLYLDTSVLEITESAVYVSRGKEQVLSLPADTVVLAVGMRSESRLAQELEGTVEVHSVGDCVRPRDAAEVAYQAARLASRL